MLRSLNIEKCSESIGIILVLYFIERLLIIFHPHITDSLLAKSTFLLFFNIKIVGESPAIPGIAKTLTSETFLKSLLLRVLIILIVFDLNFFLTFAKTFSSFIKKKNWFIFFNLLTN